MSRVKPQLYNRSLDTKHRSTWNHSKIVTEKGNTGTTQARVCPSKHKEGNP